MRFIKKICVYLLKCMRFVWDLKFYATKFKNLEHFYQFAGFIIYDK